MRLGVHEPVCVVAEARAELDAAVVGRGRHLDHGRPQREPGAGGEVRLRDVEVDVELVAGERPAVPVAGRDEVDRARVGDGQLRLRVG